MFYNKKKRSMGLVAAIICIICGGLLSLIGALTLVITHLTTMELVVKCLLSILIGVIAIFIGAKLCPKPFYYNGEWDTNKSMNITLVVTLFILLGFAIYLIVSSTFYILAATVQYQTGWIGKSPYGWNNEIMYLITVLCGALGVYSGTLVLLLSTVGAILNIVSMKLNPNQQQSSPNTVTILGFIFSFLCSITGLICSIIGCVTSKRENSGVGLSVAGIVISAISILIGIVFTIIIIINPYWLFSF